MYSENDEITLQDRAEAPRLSGYQSRTMHTERGIHSVEAITRFCRKNSHSRGLPRPPIGWTGLRRQYSPRERGNARKTSPIHHTDSGIFTGLANPYRATRYHSLVIDLANCLAAWR